MSFNIGDDVLDSRDIVARIDELESTRGDLELALSDAETALAEHEETPPTEGDAIDSDDLQAEVDSAQEALDEFDASEEGQELSSLQDFANELEGYCPDWRHGTTLIEDSHFTDYAEELCKDIGDMPKEIPSYIVIDWEATADNIKQDYTSAEIDGYTYWAR